MKKNFAVLILAPVLAEIFIAAPVRAQSDSSATLVGRVKDTETGLPLASVNIFLANTRRGAVANDSGFYSLPHSLLIPAGLPNEKQLRFKGALEITYKHSGIRKQTSWLTLEKDFAVVNTSGYVNNPYDLIINGDWALDRFARMLPRDYVP